MNKRTFFQLLAIPSFLTGQDAAKGVSAFGCMKTLPLSLKQITSWTLYSKNNEVMDVSDLNLTMDDLNKPLPQSILATIERSGYQSTSRIPDVNDNGCYWIENSNDDNSNDFGVIDVTLAIPGLRGQPPEALSVLFSTSTISVTAFGRVVWSCIQKGYSKPEECSFMIYEGKDMVPIIQLSVQKEKVDEIWGGFILQVGEDSIL